MSAQPTKRRKMRPNNAITVAKLDKERMNDVPTTSTVPTDKVLEKEVANQKKKDNSEKENGQSEKQKQTREKVGVKRAKGRAEDVSPPKAKKSKSNASKKQIPKPTTYLSASDSDDTDNEARSRNNSKVNIKPANVKATTLSASDSDETDVEEKTKNAAKKKRTMPKPKLPELSASDSDETDGEQRKKKTTTALSASDSDETDQEQQSSTAKQMSASDSDDTDVENNSKSVSRRKSETKKAQPKGRSHLTANRISFRRKQEYDDSLSAADNVKNRLSDLFVPEVNENFFISDSESETDSGEDYDSKQHPSWQRTLSAAHNKEKDPWPKQRKLGYSDKLRLEKRVKKICRREGITFNQVREIFSSSHRKEHVKFFQKIGKIFPDMSLHRLAKLCKEMYHEKRNMGPWTAEEIQKLEDLLRIHGNNPTLISEHINRSPKNISDYIYSHKKAPKKVNTKWTKAEDEILAKEAAKVLARDGKISFHSIEPLFNGTRTQKQIHTRYQTIRNLIQPDGTLAEKRKATEYEELRYLKSLLDQVRKHQLVEESQLDFAKNRGFVHPKFYLKNRAMIKGFEKMDIKTILKELIEKQKKIIASRKEEKLLESEPESD